MHSSLRAGRGPIAHVSSLLRHPLRWIRVLARSPGEGSNVARWSNFANFDEAWDERTAHLARWATSYRSVIEFGCGRGTLRKMLPEDMDYTGSDLVARDPTTLVWDLNDGAPPLGRKYDIAVFSGVLEYVSDPARLVREVRPFVKAVASSYASVDEVPDPLTRRENGWVNHLGRREFVDLFEATGLTLSSRDPWEDSSLYLFEADG